MTRKRKEVRGIQYPWCSICHDQFETKRQFTYHKKKPCKPYRALIICPRGCGELLGGFVPMQDHLYLVHGVQYIGGIECGFITMNLADDDPVQIFQKYHSDLLAETPPGKVIEYYNGLWQYRPIPTRFERYNPPQEEMTSGDDDVGATSGDDVVDVTGGDDVVDVTDGDDDVDVSGGDNDVSDSELSGAEDHMDSDGCQSASSIQSSPSQVLDTLSAPEPQRDNGTCPQSHVPGLNGIVSSCGHSDLDSVASDSDMVSFQSSAETDEDDAGWSSNEDVEEKLQHDPQQNVNDKVGQNHGHESDTDDRSSLSSQQSFDEAEKMDRHKRYAKRSIDLATHRVQKMITGENSYKWEEELDLMELYTCQPPASEQHAQKLLEFSTRWRGAREPAPNFMRKAVQTVESEFFLNDFTTTQVTIDINYLTKVPLGFPRTWQVPVQDPVHKVVQLLLSLSERQVNDLQFGYHDIRDENNYRMYSEPNTGDVIREMYESVRTSTKSQDVRLLPLIFESDGASISQTNHVEAWPVFVTTSVLPLVQRRRHEVSKRLCAFVDLPGTNRKSLRTVEAVTLHSIYKALFDFIATYQHSGGFHLRLQGEEEEHHYFPVVLFFCTDCKETDTFALVKQSFTKGFAVCRICDCSHSDMKSMTAAMTNQGGRRTLVKEDAIRQKLRTKSSNWEASCSTSNTYPLMSGFPKHKQVCLLDDSIQCGTYQKVQHSVHGSTPPEPLHVFFLGVAKELLSWLYKELVLYQDSKQNLDRNYQEQAFRRMLGRLDMKRDIFSHSGSESRDWRSLIHLFGLAIRLGQFDQFYSNHLKNSKFEPEVSEVTGELRILMAGNILNYLVQLSTYMGQVTMSSKDIDNFELIVYKLEEECKSFFTDFQSHYINAKEKFHLLGHFPEAIKRFGSIPNYDAFSLEASHKITKKYISASNHHMDTSLTGVKKSGRLSQTTKRHVIRELLVDYNNIRKPQTVEVNVPLDQTHTGHKTIRVSLNPTDCCQTTLYDAIVKARPNLCNVLPVHQLKALPCHVLVQMFTSRIQFESDFQSQFLSIGARIPTILRTEVPRKFMVLGDNCTSRKDRHDDNPATCSLVATRIVNVQFKTGCENHKVFRLFASVQLATKVNQGPRFRVSNKTNDVYLLALELRHDGNQSARLRNNGQQTSGISNKHFQLMKWNTKNGTDFIFTLIPLDSVKQITKLYAVYDCIVPQDVDTRPANEGTRSEDRLWVLDRNCKSPVERPW